MKILRGTVFGGIFYFFLGWLVFGIILMDYFSGVTNQSLNRPDGQMVWWAMIVSSLMVSLFLTLILYWSKAGSIRDGLIKGAIFGALFTGVIDFSFWSMTTMYTSLAPIFVEIVASSVVYAIVGMLIVLTWGRKKDI